MKSERIGWTSAPKAYDYLYMVEELEVLPDFDIYNSGKIQTWRKVKLSGDNMQIESQITRYFSGFFGFDEIDPREQQAKYASSVASFKASVDKDRQEFEEALNSNNIETMKSYLKSIKFKSHKDYEKAIEEAIAKRESEILIEEKNSLIASLTQMPTVIVFYGMSLYTSKNALGVNLGDFIDKDEKDELYNEDLCGFILRFLGIGFTTEMIFGLHNKGCYKVKGSSGIEMLTLEDRKENDTLNHKYLYYTQYKGPFMTLDFYNKITEKGFLFSDIYYTLFEDDFFWVVTKPWNVKESLEIFDCYNNILKKNSTKYKAVKAYFLEKFYSNITSNNDIPTALKDIVRLESIVIENTKPDIKVWLDKFWKTPSEEELRRTREARKGLARYL